METKENPQSLKNIPGPKGIKEHIFLAKELRRDALSTFFKINESYGDMAFCEWIKRPVLFIYSPELIKRILKDNHTNYLKGKQYHQLLPLLGQGLLLSEGDLWRKQRQIMAPEFHHSKLQDYKNTIQEELDLLTEEWKKHSSKFLADMAIEMTAMTFHIATRLFFGQKLAAQEEIIKKSLHDELVRANMRARRSFNPPRWWPNIENKRGNKAVTYLKELVEEVIQRHHENKENKEYKDNKDANILSRLVKAKNAEGLPLTVEQIRDEVMTLMLAGHETTSNMLSWTLYLLAQNKNWQNKLREEVKDKTKSLAEKPLIRACLKESMRLYPPIAIISRLTKAPDVLGNTFIPAGISIAAAQWVMHRHPNYWSNPSEFNPERFYREQEKINDYVYFPFAQGPRACIGEELAMIEGEMALEKLVLNFEFDLKEGHTPRPAHHITLQSTNGLPLFVTPL